MLLIKTVQRAFRMIAGEWRTDPEHDVAVGRHVTPSSARFADFMRYFEERFTLETMGRAAQIMAVGPRESFAESTSGVYALVRLDSGQFA
jgi:hypothetical protein